MSWLIFFVFKIIKNGQYNRHPVKKWSIWRHLEHVAVIYFPKMVLVLTWRTSKIPKYVLKNTKKMTLKWDSVRPENFHPYVKTPSGLNLISGKKRLAVYTGETMQLLDLFGFFLFLFLFIYWITKGGLPKKNGIFWEFFPKGGGVTPISKTFVKLPSHFWHAKSS